MRTIRSTKLLTLLDLLHEPYRDMPFLPRGAKCLNGFRQSQPRGFRT